MRPSGQKLIFLGSAAPTATFLKMLSPICYHKYCWGTAPAQIFTHFYIMENFNSWTAMWDDRYGKEEYAYGEEPNLYFKQQLSKLSPGTILCPAEGEGRNAVFAAKLGWTVYAFDISKAGKSKAMSLAQKNNVAIDYQVGELHSLGFQSEQFDALALVYAHFPANIRSEYHKALDQLLLPNGIIIMEAFSKEHLHYVMANEKVGGPRNIESLFSIEEIKADFPNYEVIELTEQVITLNEGQYHNGIGSVIRFVGRKGSLQPS